MRRSEDRIITTHVGSLPRPADLLELANAQPQDEKAYTTRLREAVAEVVRRQVDVGVDTIDDGEFGKPDFVSYVNERLTGFELRKGAAAHFQLRDSVHFPEYYAFVNSQRGPAATSAILGRLYPPLVCTGPITYTGLPALQRDIKNLQAAVNGMNCEIFIPAISPENVEYGKRNEYYRTDEEFSIAIADALNQEYRAIVDAGFLVQVDDPHLLTYFNRNPDKTVAECRQWVQGRIEIINHALRGIPEEKTRFHSCYSFDVAPRTGDMELKDILDLILQIKAGAYSLEGANPRHEHEYQLWEKTRLPEGRLLVPGVVAISTIVVEHPELVAQRIVRYAKLVGRENVIASVDCGFGTLSYVMEMHPTIAWAKLKSLVQGAALATKQLF